ncbi:polysaccharide biosynthesis/export family protein [Bradyrhizobium japonicum]|uniref:polysaccharide biosynthesis/export family protein n=1 Tax=Bradyrhizobium japonicum TaxID=375 RepID=UPI0009B90F8F|nr:polysaccharide biosynthesis/export family protein [Bradyrhizobium japonicum]
MGTIFKTKFLAGIALCAMIALAGCSQLPTSGPSGQAVKSEAPVDENSLPYALVRVNSDVVSILARNTGRLTVTYPDRQPPREIRFGVGDVVSVTIFEAAAGGLFIPAEAGVRPGNFIALPNQTVDHNGNISVPYAGAVRAQGRTPSEVQQAIADALKNRAIEPQAVVALIDQRTSLISVLGEVNNPVRYPANAAGEHLLDAITRAGGPKGQGFDTWVMLERNGKQATVPFGALVYEPSNNIWVHPNDTVYVYREPQTFVAFGATGQQGQFNFDAWRISVAEAVGKAGGLNDTLADPGAIFLYRGERREVAAMLGVDVSRFTTPIIPIVYNFNMRDPSTYFLATKVLIRNKDVLYTSNAPAVESAKLMTYIRLVTATVNDPIVAAYNAAALRNLVVTAP